MFQPTVETQIQFPHGSMFVLGMESNAKFYHSIVKEQAKELDEKMKTTIGDVEEQQEQMKTAVGHRISITFRAVGTFTQGTAIIGQGAGYQTGNWPRELRGQHILQHQEAQQQGTATTAEV